MLPYYYDTSHHINPSIATCDIYKMFVFTSFVTLKLPHLKTLASLIALFCLHALMDFFFPQSQCPTTQAIRRNDPYPHFR